MGNRSSKRFHPKYLQGLIQIQTIGIIELREYNFTKLDI